MVKLRRINEAVDSSHTSIMFNMANSFADKGWYKFHVKDSDISGWVSKANTRDSIDEKGGAYVTTDEVELRESPSKNSDVIETVRPNTTLLLEDEKDTIDATYSDKGMTVAFKLTENDDPHNTKEGKAWLKANKGKDFIYKGAGLTGNLRFNIIKNNSGKRELIVDNVIVGKDSNLLVLQKKLVADKPKEGRLTGKSVKPFEKPQPYTITNLATPTFQSYIKKTKDNIIKDIALALSEVVEKPKEESLIKEGNSVSVGDEVYDQTKFIVNKALSDSLSKHPLFYGDGWIMTDFDVMADVEDWVEGKGVVDFSVKFLSKKLHGDVTLDITFDPREKFICQYTLNRDADGKNEYFKAFRVEKDFTSSYNPDRNTPFTYLSGVLYDDLKDLMWQAIDHLKDSYEKKYADKNESSKYYIDYDENFNRVNEGYITEAETEEDQKKISWKDEDVQKAITDTIKGLEINKSKTTDKELVFKHNGKNGYLHLQGYMLVLDTDTDDDIPATNYPVKDKNNLTIENLLDTIKTVFSRREARLADSDKEEVKETKKEAHKWDDDIQSDELPSPHDLDAFYILKGKVDEEGHDFFEEIVGDEKGYTSKDEAIQIATDLRYNDPDSLFGVTELVDINYFMNDTFWDALDEGKIRVIWNSVDLSNSDMNTIEEKRLDEANEDHPVMEDPTIDNSPVFQDVAKSRFMEKLSKSLIIAPEYKGECNCLDACDGDLVWLYLSPSYAIDQLSDIVLPLCITGRKVTMPVVEMPDPNAVFGGDFSENALAEYDNAVQDYMLNDAPMSDIAMLDVDNADDVKAQVVDLVNTMADSYQNKKMELSDALDLKGDSLLKESRYFIVPSDTDLTSDKEVNKLTPLGYTDLAIAQNELNNLADSGRYDFDLKILDTNFSNNKEKWTLV